MQQDRAMLFLSNWVVANYFETRYFLLCDYFA